MKNKFSKFLILLFLSLTISCGNSISKEKNDTIEVSNTTLKNDTLVEQESEIVSEKKKILQNLIGEHSLTLISGTSGANAMSDYVFEKVKWVATGSSIYQAMRQGYDIDISDENLKKVVHELKIHLR